MTSTTPLAFRPSFAQRATALVLFLGSWMAGLRVGAELIRQFPRLWAALQQARAAEEGTALLWFYLGLTGLACVLGLLGLLASLFLVVLLEGTQVLVDQLGLAVELHLLPPTLARWAGAGRLTWKRVGRLRRQGPFFVVEGGGEGPPGPGQLVDPTLRILMVDELERLVTLILDRSPNVKVD